MTNYLLISLMKMSVIFLKYKRNSKVKTNDVDIVKNTYMCTESPRHAINIKMFAEV